MDERFRLHPEQASTFAEDIDGLYFFLSAVSAFFTLLIFVLIVYFAIKYRRRHPDEVPRPILGSLRLEILWSVIPFVFSMMFFFWGARSYFRIYRPPANAMEIHVIGKQWMWKAQHPNGMREINALHVPAGRPVKLILSSQDVIHSYFIPAFRVKQDAVPGRYTVAWFEATKIGEYRLFCAEYCGTQHSGMVGRVIVMEPSNYEAWLAGSSPDEPPAAAGARHFQSLGCLTCHGSQAPTLAGVFASQVRLANGQTVTADENYLRRSILDSTAEIVAGYKPIMPSFRGQITEEQLSELIAYIKSLKDATQGEQQPATLPARSLQPEPGGGPPLRPPAPTNERPAPSGGGGATP